MTPEPLLIRLLIMLVIRASRVISCVGLVVVNHVLTVHVLVILRHGLPII